MVEYRRNKLDSPDAVYFLTLVTRDRRRRFEIRDDFVVLWRTMQAVRESYGVVFEAWVLLPDHLHWLLRPVNADYSKVVYSFRKRVSGHYKRQGEIVVGEKFWQDRFWEHTVRNDEEYRRFVEYIHYNPVKHGYVTCPYEWKYSSVHQFIERGIYPKDWTAAHEIQVAGSAWDK